jgi:hypothetical protein
MYDELALAQLPAGAASRSARGQAAAAGPRPDTGPLPWLLYSGGTEYLAATDVQLT